MPQVDQQRTSRSLAIYGLLLHLYPQEYLRHHRAEMLQNFADFEQTSSSRAELWLFLGKDLATSFLTYLTKSLGGQTTIVATVLVLLLALARRHLGRHEHPVWVFCSGYVLGWLNGWWRKAQKYQLVRFSSHSFKAFPVEISAICIALVIMLVVDHKGAEAYAHSVWAFCYGYLIAWPAGWLGKRRQSAP